MEFNFDLPEETILIIDDNSTNLSVIADYLVDSGYGILTALSGEEGLERANHVQPQLILLDIMMPGIDGFETCRRLKTNEATQNIPVIFMSALAAADDKVKGFESGAVDYITKPIQQAEVLARIKTHMTITRLQQDIIQKNEELQQQNQRLEQKVVERTQKLQEANEVKSQFITMMSHELRTPLNVINGFTELLLLGLRGDLSADVQDDIQRIYNNSQHLLALINDVLDISQIELGHVQIDQTELEVTPFLDEIIYNSISLVKGKRLEIIKDVPDFPLSVYADPTRLKQILLNLVNNAIKFTHFGTITIHARLHSPGQSLFMVADTGLGIPPNKLKTVFGTFQQADMSDSREHSGTGLGLAICQQLVKLHGGNIWIESELGQGTRVMFTMPRAH